MVAGPRILGVNLLPCRGASARTPPASEFFFAEFIPGRSRSVQSLRYQGVDRRREMEAYGPPLRSRGIRERYPHGGRLP